MSKNFGIYFGIGIVILTVIVSGIFVYIGENSNNQNQDAGLSNPASMNCLKQGGGLGLVDGVDGQYGLCHFDDGSVCEEWMFFRGECRVGEVFVDLTNCESYFDGCNSCSVVDGKISTCTEMACQIYEKPRCNRYSALAGEFCGGIAGLRCAEGLTCILDGNFPDAGGKCE